MSASANLPDHRASIAPVETPFSLYRPGRGAMPVLVGVPHAGRVYPPEFVEGARLPLRALRRSEDALVDHLFASAVGRGATLLVAEFPRAYVDVNREPFELDPRMFDGRLPAFANTRSLRVAGGLGTIPRIVGDALDIYPGRLPIETALARIEALYRPYHAALRAEIDAIVARFGACVLVDAHSMPSSSLEREGVAKADVILGDRFGTSAAPEIVDIAEDAFRAAGLSVARNRPYAGGFITEHYGAPVSRVHALQIEINRALYMDEVTLVPHEGFAVLADQLDQIMATIFRLWFERLPGTLRPGWREAAE